MAENIILNVKKREIAGKSQNRKLRRNTQIPAIVYGGPSKEIKVALDKNQFQKELSKGGIKTRLIELQLEGQKINAITRDIQFDPVSDFPMHVDFQEVSKDTLVRIHIALRVVNAEKSPGIKRGGVVNLVYRSIPVMCSPVNIPEYIDIDVEGMEIGQNRHILDVALPENVRPVDKTNFTILSIGGSSQEEDAESRRDQADGDAKTTAKAAPAKSAAK